MIAFNYNFWQFWKNLYLWMQIPNDHKLDIHLLKYSHKDAASHPMEPSTLHLLTFS